MRLSLRWVLDHIALNFKDIDIDYLVDKLNSTTAEIENVEHFKLNPNDFTLVLIEEITAQSVKVKSLELKKSLNLPFICLDIKENNVYLVKKEKNSYNWAMLSDLGSKLDRPLTNLAVSEKELKGAWKDNLETEDYLITIENKAITNRPDLWGHRGIAREVAAILDAKLISDDNLLVSKPVKHYVKTSRISASNPFTIEIDKSDPVCSDICKRFAGLYFKKIENKPSLVFMSSRLARVDARPLNLIVDATNYVMFDLGQPMHTFDATAIKTHKIVTRCAFEGEEITLLDGDNVTLTEKDYVITDGQRPISLAGIMGGLETAVNANTNSIFLESANFDATTIRKTAMRIKKRTEASTRFEKSIDPNQNTHAILRYLKILNDYNIEYEAGDSVVSVGPLIEEKTIELSYDLIAKKIGIHIAIEIIQEILIKLGFGVQIKYKENGTASDNAILSVTVPTFRATKDITIEEDIVEEIARFIGFSSMPLTMPTRAMTPFNVAPIMRIREIKKHLAYGLGMHEVQTYAFFDEEFLKELNYEPKDTLNIANPQSENYRRLITSLIPNLLKCIAVNKSKSETLKFFELNRIWFEEDKKGQAEGRTPSEPTGRDTVESLELAGIFFEHKKGVDFYEYKNLLNSLFHALKIKIDWNKAKNVDEWYYKNQTAELLYQDRIIGMAGKIDSKLLSKVAIGDAFIFELDATFLLEEKKKINRFESLAKYPEVHIDISLLVPLNITVTDLETAIKSADKRVKQVNLIDFFSKEEWTTNKALTFRIILYDNTKTMAKEEVEQIYNAIEKKIKPFNAKIR